MITTPRTPEPPAEGELIRVARLAKGLSAEDAAALAQVKLGAARWRQIERGYKTRDEPVQAPPRTLAHMAYVVGVTPEQLDSVGRQKAAEILREILRRSDSNAPRSTPTLSPDEEVFRRMVTAVAKELGLKPEVSDEIMRRVRQDLERAQPSQAPAKGLDVIPERVEEVVRLVPQYLQQELLPVGTEVGSSRGIPYRVTGRTDLSDLMREARQESGLSLEEVSARAVDPESQQHTVDADWLDRLERVALVPDEYPEYPQLDALVDVYGLDVMDVRAAAGAQFFGLVTVWSDDGQSKTTLMQEHVTPEAIAKAKALMARYAVDKAPIRRDRK